MKKILPSFICAVMDRDESVGWGEGDTEFHKMKVRGLVGWDMQRGPCLTHSHHYSAHPALLYLSNIY